MDPSEIGPYLLLGLGAAAITSAIVGHFKELSARSTGLMLTFGLGLLGIGSYGPAFLKDYTGFVQALNQVSGDSPDQEKVAEFLGKADRAGVSEDARKAILVDVLGRTSIDTGTTTDGPDPATNEALGEITLDDANRKVLAEAKTQIQADKEVRDFARHHIEVMAENEAPPATAGGDLQPILNLDDRQLQRLQIDRSTMNRALSRTRDGQNPENPSPARNN